MELKAGWVGDVTLVGIALGMGVVVVLGEASENACQQVLGGDVLGVGGMDRGGLFEASGEEGAVARQARAVG